MKKILVVFQLLVIINCLNAIIEWDLEGVAVHQSTNAILEDCTEICQNGEIVTFWTDTREGFRSLYAQKTDSNGNKLWAENGIRIAESDLIVYDVQAVSSIENSVVFAYLQVNEFEPSDNSLHLQKINSAGDLYWGEGGKVINSYSTISKPILQAHSNGDITAFWYDGNVRAVKTHHNGVVANGWGYDFQNTTNVGINIIDCDYGNKKFTITSDHQDGFFVASALSSDIYIQHVDQNGVKLLGTLGTLLVNEDSNIKDLIINSSLEDQYYLNWTLGNPNNGELYLNKFNNEAILSWENPVLISNECQNFDLLVPEDSQPIVTWRWYNSPYYNLVTQKYSSEGNNLWGENGLIIEFPDYYNKFQIENSNDNGCIIALSSLSDNIINLKLFKVSESGLLDFDDTPILLTQLAASTYYKFSLIADENHIVISWSSPEDANSNINQQIIDYTGELGLSEEEQVIFSALKGATIDHKIQIANGLPLISWKDNRTGNYQIYVQILVEDGMPEFQENGIAISDNLNNQSSKYNVAYSENSQIISTAWHDYEDDLYHIYAQACNNSGDLLWGENNLLLAESSTYFEDNVVISNIDDPIHESFLTAWSVSLDNFTDYELKIQKIENGNTVWEENGITLISGQSQFEYLDIQDSYIIYSSYQVFNNKNIFVQKIDDNGEICSGWTQEGVQLDLSSTSLRDIQSEITPEGLLVSWNDYSSDEIKMQIVQADGTTYWEVPKSLSNQNNRDYLITYNQAIYVTIEESEDNNKSLVTYKLNLSGEQVWGQDGVEIISNLDLRSFDQVAVEDNLALTWFYMDENYQSMVKFQEITPNGNFIYSVGGVNLFGATGFSSDPQICFDGEHAYLSCVDNKSLKFWGEGTTVSQNIYAQKLSLVTLDAADELDPPPTIISNFPNPFSPSGADRSLTTTISYSLPTNIKEAEIIIYNVKGRIIKNLDILPNGVEGYSKVYWDGTDSDGTPVATGVYLYKLIADGRTIASEKMMLIK